MASRRLAISSLLCGDDPLAAPIPGPSHNSHSDAGPSNTITLSPSQRAIHGERAGFTVHQVESEYAQARSDDVVPLSFQPALHLRRRTPSPSLSSQSPPPTSSPARRRSFKEIAFDNYQGQPRNINSPYSHTFDYAEHSVQSHTFHHASPQSNAIITSSDPVHHSPSRVYNVSEPLHLPQQPRRPSLGELPRRSQSSRHSTSSIHALVNSPSQPSQTLHPSHQGLSSGSNHQHSPMPLDMQSPFVSPPSPAPHPSASPVQTFHRQHYSASVSPTHSPASKVSSSPSSASSQRPHSRHAIAALLTDSPSVPRASAASLPHILNSPTQLRGNAALPPVSPSSHGAHMGGLEALVQAASQERRRLSGEIHPETAVTTGRSVSLNSHSSPVVELRGNDRLSSPVSERGGHQVSSPVIDRVPTSQTRSPILQRLPLHATSSLQSPTHIFSSPLLEPPNTSKVAFAVSQPRSQTGIQCSHSPPFEYEGEPPAKRRRGSGGIASIPPSTRLQTSMQPSLDLHTQAQVAVSSPKLSQREPSTPPSTKPPKYSRASPAAEVKTEDLTPAVDAQEPLQLVMNPSSHRIQSPVHGRKSLTEDKRRPSSPSCPPLQSNSLPKASRPSEDTQFRHQDAVHPKDEVQASAPVRKRKKVEGKSLLKEKAAAKPVKAATHDPVPFAQPHSLTVNRAEVTEDDDPHDWLMEHYGGASTSHASHHHGASQNTVVEEKLFSSRPALSKDESSRDFGSTDDASARTSVQTVKRVLKDSKDVHVSPRMRSSTPTAMFEEEIGPVEVDQHARAPTIKSHRGSTHSLQGMKARVADVDMDLDAELDLVAGPRGTDVDATLKIDNTSEMDVEDELLSLLDDNPRPHKGSSHTHPRLEGLDLKAISPAPSAHTPTEQMLLTYSSANKSKHTTKRAEKSDRESMPPPSHTPDLAKAQDLTTSKKGEAAASANVKKKDGTVKSGPKKQTPAKPKVSKTTSAPKAAGKASGKEGSSTPVPSASNATLAVPTTSASGKVRKTTSYPAGSPSGVGAAVKRAVSSVTGGVSSRSRSTSVMPGAHDTDKAGDKKAHDGPEEEPAVDDKLYCICKTKYDEDRVMIACDRCDEWYHTQCVNMPDLEVDLVDQFICPICIANNPHLLLKTTYKQRCYSGVNHPHPSSPAACHKPARGAVSKYCSDDCAVKNMQSKIRRWGGDKAALWEGVKDADKREAVVMKCLANGELDGQQDNKASKWNEDGSPDSHVQVVKPSRTKIQREIDRLNSLLSRVPVRRNALKKEEEILLWREHLVELAIARADMMGECGWDQRLCFGDHEIVEFGSEVLKSYDNFGDQGTPDAMQVDGNEEWWCRGKKKCDRHAGWQKLRQAETELDKEVLNAGLDKITAEERDLRNRIEDIFKETSTSSNFGHKESSSDNGFVPLKLVNGDSPAAVDLAGVNCARTKVNGTGTDHRRMKGKKRKPE